ncbi:MAG: FRG domain-containing protein [Terrimicrobiaceae bacterium]
MSAPSELWTATPGKRPWQTAYQRFRELERWLTDEHPSGRAFLVLLRGAVQGRHVFDRKLREYRAVRGGPTPGRLPEPPAELVSELRAIAGLRSCYDRDACGFVFEDVYHLAFDQIMRWPGYGRPILPAADCLRLYRGQRKETWEVGAKMYRGLPDGPGREPALRARAASACRIGHAIAERLQLHFMDAMAVAQHYSAADILGVPTWLVDLSRDPWVALFFASDGGETGDFGIVWDIMPLAVFTDPFDPKTYERLLVCWLNEFEAQRAGSSKLLEARAAIADLARFHARLHSPSYAGRLPNIVSRSLNRLRDAFETFYFQASRGEPVSFLDAVKKSYVNQTLWDGDHVAVLMEALNERAPCSDATRPD